MYVLVQLFNGLTSIWQRGICHSSLDSKYKAGCGALRAQIQGKYMYPATA